MEKKKESGKKKQPKSSIKHFARLSGIGIQMGVIIFLFAYGGKYLDEKYPHEKNWFTIGLTLLGVAVSLYYVLKQVNQLNDKDSD